MPLSRKPSRVSQRTRQQRRGVLRDAQAMALTPARWPLSTLTGWLGRRMSRITTSDESIEIVAR